MSAFVSILSQVVSRRLPSEFDYHGVPAPWIQLHVCLLLLLHILALGADDSKLVGVVMIIVLYKVYVHCTVVIVSTVVNSKSYRHT